MNALQDQTLEQFMLEYFACRVITRDEFFSKSDHVPVYHKQVDYVEEKTITESFGERIFFETDRPMDLTFLIANLCSYYTQAGFLVSPPTRQYRRFTIIMTLEGFRFIVQAKLDPYRSQEFKLLEVVVCSYIEK